MLSVGMYDFAALVLISDRCRTIPIVGSCVTTLGLSFNEFIGTIPIQMQSLTSLTYLGMSFNRLSGTTPSLHALSALQFLYLDSNVFSGTLQRDWGPYLSLFDVINNSFTGYLPNLRTSAAIYVIIPGVVTVSYNVLSTGFFQQIERDSLMAAFLQ